MHALLCTVQFVYKEEILPKRCVVEGYFFIKRVEVRLYMPSMYRSMLSHSVLPVDSKYRICDYRLR